MTLHEAVCATIRRLHYSPRTEEAWSTGSRAFIDFHAGRHPREMGAAEMTAFLNDLAVERHVAASTQNQALCAVVFLYQRVLCTEAPELRRPRAGSPPPSPPSRPLPALLRCSRCSNAWSPPSGSSARSSTAAASASWKRWRSGSRTWTSSAVRSRFAEARASTIAPPLLPGAECATGSRAQLDGVAERHRAEASPPAAVKSTCPTPCARRCRRPRRVSPGSTSSLPRAHAPTRRRVVGSSTTCTSPSCRRRSAMLAARAARDRQARRVSHPAPQLLADVASWQSRARTSAPSRPCSATRTSARR